MNSLDKTLELFAAQEADPSAVAEAQHKLESLLAAKAAVQTARRPALRVGGWLAASASAAVVALALLWLPLHSAPAFAAVQQHLRDFRTMRFTIEQRAGDQEVIKTVVYMTHDGNVRTEVGDVSVIVNSKEQRVLTLVSSAHVAVVEPLTGPVTKDDELAWLKDIRDFQGAAKALPQSRIIDGRRAFGWQLDVEDIDMVLWADENGLPLEMTMDQGQQLQLNFRFEIDLPMEPQMFSTEIPAGYSLGTQED